jgi:hypothetical protein
MKSNKILFATLAISLASLGFVPSIFAQDKTTSLPYAYSQVMKRCIGADQSSSKTFIESSCLTDPTTRMDLCWAFSDLENGTLTGHPTRSPMHNVVCSLALAGMKQSVNATGLTNATVPTPVTTGNMTTNMSASSARSKTTIAMACAGCYNTSKFEYDPVPGQPGHYIIVYHNGPVSKPTFDPANPCRNANEHETVAQARACLAWVPTHEQLCRDTLPQFLVAHGCPVPTAHHISSSGHTADYNLGYRDGINDYNQNVNDLNHHFECPQASTDPHGAYCQGYDRAISHMFSDQ